MRVKRFEGWLAELVESAGHPEVKAVETFEQGGYTDKPCGLHITFHSGAEVFMQFVRTSPPEGDDHSRPERIVARPDYDVREGDQL